MGETLEGFEPSIDGQCRVLILGSAPSVRSLATGQYYGNPRNAFWFLMETLFDVPRTLAYEDRLRRLRRAGVAIWDVVRRCRRHASSDATIEDVLANDFGRLFARHPALQAVFFNGAKSEELFEMLVRSRLAPASPLHFERLPSTSPANATWSRERKLAAWEVVRAWADAASRTRPRRPGPELDGRLSSRRPGRPATLPYRRR